MQPSNSLRFGVHHLADGLAVERRDQLLALYRATRNCYSGKVSDALLAQRYAATLCAPRFQVMTLDSASALEGSVMAELLPSGDCAITAVCATSSAACRCLLLHALRCIRRQAPGRIVSGVAPEVRIANLLFGPLGFVGTGIREREPGVVVFDVERRASELSAFERGISEVPESKPGYAACEERTFAICAPESPRYARDIAILQSACLELFTAGHALIHYSVRDGTARCVFGERLGVAPPSA